MLGVKGKHAHLSADELETPLHGALRLELLLLEEHGADELVYHLVILEVVELLEQR